MLQLIEYKSYISSPTENLFSIIRLRSNMSYDPPAVKPYFYSTYVFTDTAQKFRKLIVHFYGNYNI